MSSLIPHDYRYKISSPTPVDKEPKKRDNFENRKLSHHLSRQLRQARSIVQLNFCSTKIAEQTKNKPREGELSRFG